MKIEDGFDYNASYDELADEFCMHDSSYQAETINEIGLQFKIWAQDKTAAPLRPARTAALRRPERKRRTAPHEQILEIVEHLNDDGKWFIKELCECMNNCSEGNEK